MPKAVDIHAELAKLPVLESRTPNTTPEEAGPSFATLARFGDGGVYAGTFRGESAWERHPSGDEIVQVLNGAATVTILVGEERHELEMTSGMLAVVPAGCWHKFNAPDGVTVMTATPPPTDHSSADDPR
jgi:mannose-6-phosphate isomerase-like protein (cupin superfamily)